jgi:hypothetical protein
VFGFDRFCVNMGFGVFAIWLGLQPCFVELWVSIGLYYVGYFWCLYLGLRAFNSEGLKFIS